MVKQKLKKEYADYQKAHEYYLKATKLESCGSFNNIGVLYHNGSKGFERDYKKAREYYEMSIMYFSNIK
jgi:TPR repeat protein